MSTILDELTYSQSVALGESLEKKNEKENIEILGVACKNDEEFYIVYHKNGATEVLRENKQQFMRKYPMTLLKYYEQHINFKDILYKDPNDEYGEEEEGMEDSLEALKNYCKKLP